MASLLANSSLALWIWIVIIVVGSLVVLSITALIARLLILRQRRATFIETFGDENLPQRKLTVRRGRVVASTNHLSLTGSKFGLNAFNQEEVDTNSRIATRSKSPFEWWNALKDRSYSRSSQVTQTTQTTHDTTSVLGLQASPNRHMLYQRQDAAYSNLSLASSSKEDDVATIITELQPASPPPVAARKPPNFSRSFSNKSYPEDFPSRQHTLSRIEEASPHTSMISTRNARNTSRASHARDTSTATPSPLPPSYSPIIPQSPTIRQQGQSEQISSTGLSGYNDMLEVPSRSLDLSDGQRIQHNSTISFVRPEPARISAISSQNSFLESISQNHSRPQSQITALPPTSDSSSLKYWNTRSDLRPIRSSSKKGNVLRKKSLSRSEMTARFEL